MCTQNCLEIYQIQLLSFFTVCILNTQLFFAKLNSRISINFAILNFQRKNFQVIILQITGCWNYAKSFNSFPSFRNHKSQHRCFAHYADRYVFCSIFIGQLLLTMGFPPYRQKIYIGFLNKTLISDFYHCLHFHELFKHYES